MLPTDVRRLGSRAFARVGLLSPHSCQDATKRTKGVDQISQLHQTGVLFCTTLHRTAQNNTTPQNTRPNNTADQPTKQHTSPWKETAHQPKGATMNLKSCSFQEKPFGPSLSWCFSWDVSFPPFPNLCSIGFFGALRAPGSFPLLI